MTQEQIQAIASKHAGRWIAGEVGRDQAMRDAFVEVIAEEMRPIVEALVREAGTVQSESAPGERDGATWSATPAKSAVAVGSHSETQSD